MNDVDDNDETGVATSPVTTIEQSRVSGVVWTSNDVGVTHTHTHAAGGLTNWLRHPQRWRRYCFAERAVERQQVLTSDENHRNYVDSKQLSTTRWATSINRSSSHWARPGRAGVANSNTISLLLQFSVRGTRRALNVEHPTSTLWEQQFSQSTWTDTSILSVLYRQSDTNHTTTTSHPLARVVHQDKTRQDKTSVNRVVEKETVKFVLHWYELA